MTDQTPATPAARRQAAYRQRQKERLAQVSTPVIQAVTAAPSNDRLRQRLIDLEGENQRLHDRVMVLEVEVLRLKARSRH